MHRQTYMKAVNSRIQLLIELCQFVVNITTFENLINKRRR